MCDLPARGRRFALRRRESFQSVHASGQFGAHRELCDDVVGARRPVCRSDRRNGAGIPGRGARVDQHDEQFVLSECCSGLRGDRRVEPPVLDDSGPLAAGGVTIETNSRPSLATMTSLHARAEPSPMANAPATVVPRSAAIASATTVGLWWS